MIINLWSTPRTGSNWYAEYLSSQQKKLHNRVSILHQYLNYFHFINYIKPGYGDWVYEYKKGYSYPGYRYNFLTKAIEPKINNSERDRNPKEEEQYRIDLLERHDHLKTHLILHNHILPMSDKSYNYLFNKADKNIFLYRENHIDQLSSYALAYGTNTYKKSENYALHKDVYVDKQVLENLSERIIYWHNIDKKKCDVVKYEDLDFCYETDRMPKKQNIISSYSQLDERTKNVIMLLNEKIKQSINRP